MAEDTRKGDMQAVIEVAKQAASFTDPGIAGVMVALDVDGCPKLVDLQEKMAAPRRFSGTLTALSVAGFAELWRRHGGNDGAIYIDERNTKIEAVFNEHGGAPAWRDFRAELAFRRSVQWERWQKVDNQWLPQEPFAEFLEDNMADIRHPDAAALLEMAQNMELTKGVAFQSKRLLANGETALVYSEQIRPNAGREVVIYDRLMLGIPIFDCAEPYQVEARLRYRVGPDKALAFKLVLRHRVDVERAVARDVAEAVRAALPTATFIDGVP